MSEDKRSVDLSTKMEADADPHRWGNAVYDHDIWNGEHFFWHAGFTTPRPNVVSVNFPCRSTNGYDISSSGNVADWWTEESCWSIHEIEALPPEEFGLEFALLFEGWPVMTVGLGGLTALDANPDAAAVFTGIVAKNYLGEDGSPGNYPEIAGPDPVKEPELARLRFDQLMADYEGAEQGERHEYIVTLNGAADAVREAAEQHEFPLLFGVRWWIDPHPYDLNRIVTYDQDGHYTESARMGLVIYHGYDGPQQFIPERAPKLVMTMSCPSDDGDGDGGGGGIGDSRTASSRRRRDRLPEHSLEAFLQSVAEPPVRLTGKVRQDDE